VYFVVPGFLYPFFIHSFLFVHSLLWTLVLNGTNIFLFINLDHIDQHLLISSFGAIRIKLCLENMLISLGLE
jgi:hypothetical protein